MLRRRDILGLLPVARLSAAVPPPNIILVLADDLGWTDLGCFGSRFYETPNIDRLAAEGVRFTNAYAACPVCSPTRASIMTGKYPARLHLTDWIPGRTPPGVPMRVPPWTPYLGSEETTLAEAIRPAGYRSASIGKWHLGPQPFFPERQGFAVNFGGTETGGSSRHFFPYNIANITTGRDGEYLADRLTTEACAFIDQARGAPFFLYLSHYDVHTPLQAKAEVIAKYKRKARPENPHRNPVYAAMVEGLDDSVGRIVRKIEEHKLTNRTVFVFLSDNGGVIGRGGITSNAPLRGEKAQLYEGGIRIPMIVRWPGTARPGATIDVPVITNDLFPAIVEIAGADLPGNYPGDGVSLVPLLRGVGALPPRPLYWHYPHYNYHQALTPVDPCGAVRTGDWKLIEHFSGDRIELYNLGKDPGESHDLARTEAGKAAELRGLLAHWRQSVGAQMPEPDPANYDPSKTKAWIENRSWTNQ